MGEQRNRSGLQTILSTLSIAVGILAGSFFHLVGGFVGLKLAFTASCVVVLACAIVLLYLHKSIVDQLHRQEASLNTYLDKVQRVSSDLAAEMRSERLQIRHYRAQEQPGGDQSGLTRIYDEAARSIREAQKEILVLTSYLSSRGADGVDGDHQAENRYFQAILEQVRGNPKIKYFRLLQHAEGRSLADATSLPNGRHYLEVCELDLANVVFHAMKSTTPTTFVLIDGSILLWQVSALHDDGSMKIISLFVVTDPVRTITRDFEEAFWSYWNKVSYPIDVEKEFATFRGR